VFVFIVIAIFLYTKKELNFNHLLIKLDSKDSSVVNNKFDDLWYY